MNHFAMRPSTYAGIANISSASTLHNGSIEQKNEGSSAPLLDTSKAEFCACDFAFYSREVFPSDAITRPFTSALWQEESVAITCIVRHLWS